MGVSSDRWPHVFDSLKSQLTENRTHVTIAEAWEEQKAIGLCARPVTCGLVREAEYEATTGEQDLGHDVQSSGPVPYPRDDEYVPRFWIFGTEAIPEHIEP
jgi:hypothetical protein